MSSLKQRKKSRRQPRPSIRVSIACNGDGGVFVGEAEGVSFSAAGETIDLDLTGGAAPRFTELPDGIRIFRRRFAVQSCAAHVGNWCWNEYTLALDDAAALLHLALTSKKFTCGGTWGNNACRLSDAIDEGASLDELMLYLSLFGSERE